MKPAVPDPPQVHALLWTGFGGEIGWDVGANCGQTIPEMMARFTTVAAFEPVAECIPYLEAAADHASGPAHRHNVRLFTTAISDVVGTIDLVALPDKIDTGQLVTAGTKGMEWDPDDPAAEVRSVEAWTVDALATSDLGAPDFMKIDVEGHELKVLYGARKTLAIKRPDLLIEFHSPQLHDSCQALLHGFGYQTFTVRHPHYPPGTDLWFQHGWLRAKANGIDPAPMPIEQA